MRRSPSVQLCHYDGQNRVPLELAAYLFSIPRRVGVWNRCNLVVFSDAAFGNITFPSIKAVLVSCPATAAVCELSDL